MIIISDTSPISNLFVIEKLYILEQVFQNIIIPQAVFNELLKLEEYGYPIRDIESLSWISIMQPTDKKRINQLSKELDLGETEAIVLAAELGADFLLIDERAGWRKAQSLGLHTIGLLGTLVKAKQKGIINEVKIILDELIEKAGLWVSAQLREEILRSVNEL